MRRRAHAVRMLVAAAVCVATGSACSPGEPPVRVAGGEPERGARLIAEYGCGSCHTIPGVQGAESPLAPPLTAFGRRAFVNGVPNTPSVLMAWIRDPRAFDPRTPMPDLGVSEEDARHIAAYLYTLR